MERKSLWMALLVGGLLVLVGLSHRGIQWADAQVPELEGGHPDFNLEMAFGEGYWYSRYNLGQLVMRSGMGEIFMPDTEMVQMMIQMADADPNDGDTVTPPTNPALLRSVYGSGDPHYTQLIDLADFATQRWDPVSFNTTVTTPALGWTMIKETEWAKQFHIEALFGTPEDNFGAQWRFVGMVLNVEAKMQGQFAFTQLKNAEGFIANSDGEVDWDGQWVMLEALSDEGGMLNASSVQGSETNRYRDPEAAAMFLGSADALFEKLTGREPADTEELSLAVQALTWYAAHTKNAGNQARARALIARFGDALIGADTPDAARRGHAIRGLIEASRVTRDGKYLTGAASVFGDLLQEYDGAHGVFTSQSTYTVDDVGVILGGLNALMRFGGDSVDQGTVAQMLMDFFESAVNMSGLQQSAPPLEVGKSPFELEEGPELFFRYPTIPMPPMAGGDFGIAPVTAARITWSDGQWTVDDRRFDTAGAMHMANETIWFGIFGVNGFPEVGIITSVDDASDVSAAVPEDFKLFQNHPNPFNPETTIGYQLPGDAHVTMKIYNIRGQLVKTLVDKGQKAGLHTVRWDGRGDDGTRVASGVYFYRMEARTGLGTSGFVEMRKMVLLE